MGTLPFAHCLITHVTANFGLSSTAVVLDHFAESVNKTGGIRTKEGGQKEVHVALLAGAGEQINVEDKTFH